MNQGTLFMNDETVLLAGSAVSSRSAPAAGNQVIPFQRPTAAAFGPLDASSSIESFESIGLLAVRIVSRFKRPTCKLRTQTAEGA